MQRVASFVHIIESESANLAASIEEIGVSVEGEGAIINRPDWSDSMRNLVAALFRLEHNRDEQDMLQVLGTLLEWL
ncbi:MAG: hypothetical protein SVU24_09325 [Pseudomonadota bacterium]|jgi:hypothetical protein|nr:hypothetical protein [Pseudomonadota bacterium]